MRNWKNLLTLTAVALFALAASAVAIGIVLSNFLVDLWWFYSLEYGNYFWLRLLYRYIFSGGVTVFFFLIFFLNFWAASRYLGVDEDTFSSLGRGESGRHYRRVLKLFQSGSVHVYGFVSLILAIMIAAPFYQQWETALLFFFGPDSGTRDPVFGQDVNFYMFRLPIFDLVQEEMLIASSILVFAIALLYWLEHQLIPAEKRQWPRGAKIHLSLLVFVTALIMAWGFIIERHQLLFTSVHEPVFFGPGFVEMRYIVPLIWLSVFALLAATLSGTYWAHVGKGLKTTLIFALVLLAAWGLRHSTFFPKMLDRFVVKPNPVKMERTFMENNIKSTLKGFDLDNIKLIPVTAPTIGAEMIEPDTRNYLHDIPVWDPEFLDDVYQQMQGIRPYYSFTDVDAGRYNINGRLEQVNLAAREINIEKLPQEAQNWENRHLRYTHGFGAVITPTAQSGEAPMQWYLRDLNLQSDVGFKIEKPDIYFGSEKLDYVIVPNRLRVPSLVTFDDMATSQTYSGKDGIPISSLFRKFLIAFYFKDEKLFFSVNIDSNSRALFRRNIVERIKTLTPYLSLDHDPYIVVTSKRIFWVQDAYTTSRWYPVSHDYRFSFRGIEGEEPQQFSYIRNSVKIIVDAFDGTVDYYISDSYDPIIQGYKKAYPGLFKDVKAMPPLLREQLRYPKDILQVQMAIYAKYHQTDPALFYQQSETWDFAKVGDKIMKPYYFTTSLIGADEVQPFVLLNPMTPIGRGNLSMLGVAGTLKSDAAGQPYGKKVVVYRFNREVQVDGPSQVSALIDQSPEISSWFSLWDQRGSHVQRGRIIVLPIGKSIIYVQPVYIVSTGNIRIPELVRIILSMGNVVVMETSLEKAWEALESRLRGEKQPLPSGAAALPLRTLQNRD